MAISKAQKVAYSDEVKDIKKEVDHYTKLLNEIASKKKKNENLAGYYNIESVMYHLKIINYYFKMNDLSVEMLGIKNNKFLDTARSDFSKILAIMIETVGKDIDRSLKENDDYLEKISRINPKQILDLLRNLDQCMLGLKNRYGEDSKWKWSFVELQAKMAVIIKNITPFSDIAKLRDPRVEFFYERRDLMQYCKDSLTESAKQYRGKYEMAGKARDDLKKSIEYLSALRKIHLLFKEEADAAKLKTTIDAAKQALESEDKAIEEKKSAKK
jgi:hypothetical protein